MRWGIPTEWLIWRPWWDDLDDIVFQINFLDCVIGRPRSTTYGVYALLREAPSSLAKNII